MSFHRSNKYSSIEEQRIHELKYKKFLKTLPTNKNNSSEQNLSKQRQIYFNNNYFTQRKIDFQYRQDRRKHEYERIQKENFKFSQRLINAKASLNRNEQQAFFDKHCKLKQRLQHYPDISENQIKKLHFSLSSKNPSKIIHKPRDSSFLIYNDKTLSHKSTEICTEKNSLSNTNRFQLSEKKLPRLKNHNPQSSKPLSPITSNIRIIHSPTTKTIKNSNVQSTPSPNTIHWNNSTSTTNPALNILSSQSSSSDLFI